MKKSTIIVIVCIVCTLILTCFSSTSGPKCRYKVDGVEVCDSICTEGSNFCKYHKNYLDSVYHSYVN